MRNANKNVMLVYSLDDVHLREEFNYQFNRIQNLNTHFILRTKKDEKPTKKRGAVTFSRVRFASAVTV